MNYKTTAPALLFLLLASGSGAELHTKSTTGTVVVIGWSQTKIVIAVDSRGFDDKDKYRDDICKIVRLDDHSVFTAAGNIIHAHAGRALWNAQAEASNAFQEAQKTAGPRLLKSAAKDWGDRMVTGINQALTVDPSGSQLMLENNIFLTGVFIGFENGLHGDVSGGNRIRPWHSTGQTELLYRAPPAHRSICRIGPKRNRYRSRRGQNSFCTS